MPSHPCDDAAGAEVRSGLRRSKSLPSWSFCLALFLSADVAFASDLERVEIPFRLHGHLIVVEGGSIGELDGLNFVLDTGASLTAVRPGVGDRLLHLVLDTGASDLVLYRNRTEGRMPMRRTSERKPIVFMGGRTTVRKVFLPEVVLAETRWEEVPAFLLDGNSPQHGIDGMLGVSGLGLQKLHLDFVANRVGWER